jgi:hypothetical protein
MAETKSGISGPTDAPSKPLQAPVKIFPGSKDIGKGGKGPSVSSPCDCKKK